MKSMDFRDQDLKDRIRRWWDSLQAARGDRAELERATRIDSVFECASFYRLKRLLEHGDFKLFDPALARMAGVLGRIRRDRDGERFGVLLSQHIKRFEEIKRILRIHHEDRLLHEFQIWIERLKGEAPLIHVAETVYWWEKRAPNQEFFYDFFLKEGA